MMASTSPAVGVFKLRFTKFSLSSRRTIYGPDDVASSYSAPVATAPVYSGGVVVTVRRRRWTGPTSLSALPRDEQIRTALRDKQIRTVVGDVVVRVSLVRRGLRPRARLDQPRSWPARLTRVILERRSGGTDL